MKSHLRAGTIALLGLALSLGCSTKGAELGDRELRIIDTHTHFWDPARPVPAGRPSAVPFSNGRTVLPEEYLRAAQAAGISGTVVVEASGWVEDNEWVLALARKNPIIVGLVGNLNEVLGTPRFPEVLSRLSADPLFRGIRLSRAEDLAKPAWREHLGMLAEKGLTADLNASGVSAVETAAANAPLFPGLKIVLDHSGYIDFCKEPSPEWVRAMTAAARCPNIYCKVSRFQEQAGVLPAPRDVGPYRRTLDLLWASFGEDRLVFGSNWPLSEKGGSLADAVAIMKVFFDAKGESASRKFFAANAKTVYRWVER